MLRANSTEVGMLDGRGRVDGLRRVERDRQVFELEGRAERQGLC